MRERHSGEPPPPTSAVLVSATVYKGTTLPHIVVKRTAHLFAGGFATCQEGKSAAAGKFWPLHRRCALDPPDAALIRLHERHVRKAGPLRAVASYARDKNVLKLVRVARAPPRRRAGAARRARLHVSACVAAAAPTAVPAAMPAAVWARRLWRVPAVAAAARPGGARRAGPVRRPRAHALRPRAPPRPPARPPPAHPPQYCFRIEWPDKHAPSHGSVVELGFDDPSAARQWHGLVQAQLAALQVRRGAARAQARRSPCPPRPPASGSPAWPRRRGLRQPRAPRRGTQCSAAGPRPTRPSPPAAPPPPPRQLPPAPIRINGAGAGASPEPDREAVSAVASPDSSLPVRRARPRSLGRMAAGNRAGSGGLAVAATG
jgi:hypothetical protein